MRWGEDASRRERYQLGCARRRARGRPRWTGCCSGSRWRRRTSGSSARCCRSTTSARPTSTSSGAWRSSSTGSPARSHDLDGRATRGRLVRHARPTPSRLLTDVAPGRPVAAGRGGPRARRGARTASAATHRCGWPTSSRCSSRSCAGRPTRSGFRTGALTVCSLEPMRAVPHRVVALLGMDDGAFPRGSGRDGDDVLARDPLVGERDRPPGGPPAVPRRGDQRPASTWSSCTRAPTSAPAPRRPPAVPVGELLDALDAAVAYPEGGRARPGGPPPAADRRRAQLHCRARSAAPSRSASTCSTSPRRSRGAAGRRRRRPSPRAAARPERRRRSTSTTWRPPWSTRSARSSDGGSARPCPATSRSSTTACRSSSTAWTGGPSATGCCRPRSTASTSPTPAAAERRRGHMPPADARRCDAPARSARRSSRCSRRRERYLVEPADERRRHDPARRRTHARRHGQRRARRRPGPHGVLPARRQAPAARLGAAARAGRRVPRPHVRRR